MEIYHSKNLRRGRHTEKGRPYLITTVTRDRQPIFQSWQTGRLLVAELRKASEHRQIESLAWVVMPDHLHWLMIPADDPLEVLMRRVKSCSARSINSAKGTSGPVWQSGYHDHAMRRKEDLVTTARYIIANPLRAGIVKDVGDYPLWDCIYL